MRSFEGAFKGKWEKFIEWWKFNVFFKWGKFYEVFKYFKTILKCSRIYLSKGNYIEGDLLLNWKFFKLDYIKKIYLSDCQKQRLKNFM